MVVTGRGGLRRIVPLSRTFFAAADDYVAKERPEGLGTSRLFVAIKGRRRGAPLAAPGVQEMVGRLCTRAGPPALSAGDLRLACLGALRAAGMSTGAIRAFAGHPPAPGRPAVTEAQVTEEYRRATWFLELDWWNEEDEWQTGNRPARPPRSRRVGRKR